MTTFMGIYLIKLTVKKLGYKGALFVAVLPLIVVAVCIGCML